MIEFRSRLVALCLTILSLSSVAFSQVSESPLISGDWPSPFKNQPQAMSTSQRALNEVEFKLEALIRKEEALLKNKAEIESKGYSALGFFGEMTELIQSEAYNQDHVDRLLEHTNKEVTNHLLTAFEDLTQESLDLTLALVYHETRKRISETRIRNPMDLVLVKKAWSEIEKLRLKYYTNRDQFKKSKDTHRSSSFKKAIINMRKLHEYLDSTESFQARKSYWQTRWTSLINQLRIAKALWPEIKAVLKNVFHVQQPSATNNPLFKSVNQLSIRAAEELGRTVEITGLEHLPDPKNIPKNEVYFSIQSHRDAMMDQVALAMMGLDHAAPFAAVSNFAPPLPFVKARIFRNLNTNLGFIVVGSGADPKPVEKMIQTLLESGVRHFIIYPEGRLPEGLGAIAGVRENFFGEKGAIAAAEKLGFKAHLIAATFIDNAGLFDGPSLTTESRYRVEIHGVIRDEVRRAFTRHGESALSWLLDYGLIETLVTNEKLIFGQVRPSQIKKIVLEEYVKGQRACRQSLGK
jgi:hypothetical protein